ncbi:hypothetical protein [Chromohalobacter israelensis]|uniref:hypothetical protein n=1 Tax=Chromohalobacter israelensis TaxID=141390 RepID=UPI0015C4DF78|nr:hypothetical protein [Chromohalobacter salexigens]NWO56186.1 hypothetical protein [Chromohalobacter salexigens]
MKQQLTALTFAALMALPAAGALANDDGAPDTSAQVGSANTEEGSTKVEGGTASGTTEGHVDGENSIPGGEQENLSTETGSANTEHGDTEAQGGTAAAPSADDGPVPEGMEDPADNHGVDSAQDVDPN